MTIEKFIDEGGQRFLDNRRRDPLVSAIPFALGFSEYTIVGTYDHLRSPFSNRILVGDERFSRLCRETGTQGVLLVLDCTMLPASRCRGTHVGHTIGLCDFSSRDELLDKISADGMAYFSYQRASPLTALSDKFWCRFKDVFANLLRRDTKLPRKRALSLSNVILSRAHLLESLYLTAFSEASRVDDSVAHALLRARGKVRQHCGLKDVPEDISIVLYSDFRRAIASAIEHLLEHLGISHRFWSACTHFMCVNSDGQCCGKYEYETGTNKFFLSTGDQREQLVTHDDMLARLAEGTAVPTTPMMYALLHLAGGIAHYGDSCGMNSWLSSVLDISQPCVDITRDGSNSFPVGTIAVRVRKHNVLLRNVSADLLWHTPSTYRKYIDWAVLTGLPAFSLNFAEDIPEE